MALLLSLNLAFNKPTVSYKSITDPDRIDWCVAVLTRVFGIQIGEPCYFEIHDSSVAGSLEYVIGETAITIDGDHVSTSAGSEVWEIPSTGWLKIDPGTTLEFEVDPL
jgi:hypothetical protein